jgi:hypothetical protein
MPPRRLFIDKNIFSSYYSIKVTPNSPRAPFFYNRFDHFETHLPPFWLA